MANQYWLIELDGLHRRLAAVSLRGSKTGGPHERIHWRLNLLQTQAIVQAELSEVEIAWLQAQAWATYLGDNVNGTAEPRVIDYLTANTKAWNKDA